MCHCECLYKKTLTLCIYDFLFEARRGVPFPAITFLVPLGKRGHFMHVWDLITLLGTCGIVGLFMTPWARVKVHLSMYTRNKTHCLVDLLPLIFFFPWYKQVVAMSSFLTHTGSCIHLIFVLGLDWTLTPSQDKMTSFLICVLSPIKPFYFCIALRAQLTSSCCDLKEVVSRQMNGIFVLRQSNDSLDLKQC